MQEPGANPVSISGKIICADSGSPLKPVLKKWQEVLAFYRNQVCWEDWKKPDAPYWYNERTNVGMLSAAAWLCGGLALEEFSGKKAARDGKPYSGRVDLRIQVGTTGFAFEAKHKWLWVGSRSFKDSNWDSSLDSRLNEACCACRKVGNSFGRRLGLLFVVPALRKAVSRGKWDPQERLVNLKREFRKYARAKSEEAELEIYGEAFFPLEESPEYKERFYPGIFLLARKVQT